jgi:hypothetical protein
MRMRKRHSANAETRQTDRHKLGAIIAAARCLRYRGASHPASRVPEISDQHDTASQESKVASPYHVNNSVLELNLHTSLRCSADAAGYRFRGSHPRNLARNKYRRQRRRSQSLRSSRCWPPSPSQQPIPIVVPAHLSATAETTTRVTLKRSRQSRAPRPLVFHSWQKKLPMCRRRPNPPSYTQRKSS